MAPRVAPKKSSKDSLQNDDQQCPSKPVTIADDYIMIKCSTSKTVSFFASHREMAERLPDLIDMMADSLEMCVQATSAKQTSNAIMDAIRGLESRQESMILSKLDTMRSSINTDMTDMGSRLTNTVSSFSNDIRHHMLSVMTAIDTAVKASLEKISVTSISSAVSTVVNKYLSDEVACIRNDNVTLRDMITAELKLLDSRNDNLTTILQSLPGQMSCLLQQTDDKDEIKKSLCEIRQKVDDVARNDIVQQNQNQNICAALKQVADDVDELWSEFKYNAQEQGIQLKEQFSNMPVMVKGTLSSMINEKSHESIHATALAKSMQGQLVCIEREFMDHKSSMAVLRKTTDDVASKLDVLNQQMIRNGSSNKVKGQQGENMLYELLCNRLTSHENFTVEQVNGQAHSCDLNIKRLGHCDVRLESKAHGQTSGEKVRAKEVTRFQTDLLGLNSHGIFVSLHSDIVGKSSVSIEQLASGKFAVYLSNNNYDVNIIQDMVCLIHRLDKICDRSSDEINGTIRLSQDTLTQIQLYLKDFASKAASLKTHLKESLNIVNTITFDAIEQMLKGQTSKSVSVPTTPPESVTESSKYVCKVCDKHFRTKTALTSHGTVHKRASKALERASVSHLQQEYICQVGA